MYAQTSEAFARAYWHWFFLIQPAPLPEQMLAGHGPQYVRSVLGGRYAGLAPFPADVLQAYERFASDPATLHAICEDYRASAGIDLDHDREDIAAGRLIQPPTLVLWGRHGVVARCFDIAGEWRRVARHIDTAELDCGHYLPEEAPDAVCDQLLRFFSGHVSGPVSDI
jgi:haloacetate dehalogenase